MMKQIMCNYNFCFYILFSKMPHEVPDLKYCFKLISEAAEMGFMEVERHLCWAVSV